MLVRMACKDTQEVSCLVANLLCELEREDPRKRLALQRAALRECRKMERRIQRMLESKQYPGVNAHRAATWSKDVLTVRYMCAGWYKKDQERAANVRKDTRR